MFDVTKREDLRLRLLSFGSEVAKDYMDIIESLDSPLDYSDKKEEYAKTLHAVSDALHILEGWEK